MARLRLLGRQSMGCVVLQAVAVTASCFGPEGLFGALGPFALFLGAAFLLLLGAGRLSAAARHLMGLASERAEDERAATVPWPLEAPFARALIVVTNSLAALYIPAALLAGAGLAGEFILGQAGLVTLILELSGAGLALGSLGLVGLSNYLVRHAHLAEHLTRRSYRRPSGYVNEALRARGTNRFEIVMVSLVVFSMGGYQGLAAAFPTDCPPTEQIGAAQSGLAASPPGLPFGRIASRSNGQQDATPGASDGWPLLRLERLPAETAPAPPAEVISEWLELSTLALSRPTFARQPAPVLRPKFVLLPRRGSTGPAVPPPNLFGTVARATNMAPPVWQMRVRSGVGEFQRCLDNRGACASNADRWSAFARRTEGLEGFELYSAVNRFVNQNVRFQADESLAEVMDDWVTPASLISRGEGDCEDFALAKFWLLEMLGVSRDDLYIVVVEDLVVQLPHAFLVIRDGEDVWLLDSRTNRPLAPEEVDDVVPVVTIGDSAAYLHGRPLERQDPGTPMSWLMNWLPFS